jgi:hypothetical protein
MNYRTKHIVVKSDAISNDRVNLNHELIQGIKNIKIESVSIPYSYYLITTANQSINWNDSVPAAQTCNIPVGNYSGTTLATAIQTAMNAVVAGYTVTYDPANYKLTWTHAANFELLATSTSWTIIGKPVMGAPATSATSTQAVDLQGDLHIFVKSGDLATMQDPLSYITASSQSDEKKIVKPYICSVPVITNSGGVIVYMPDNLNINRRGDSFSLKNIELKLVSQNAAGAEVQIELNGLHWEIAFKLSMI